MTKVKLKKKGAGGGGAAARLAPTNLLTSLFLVFPLFLIYQLGVLLLPRVHNGADLITTELLSLLHGAVGTYVLINLGLGALFVVAVLWLRRTTAFSPRMFLPVLLESGIYALTMGSLILFVMQDVLHVDPKLAQTALGDPGPLEKIVLALGAGVHEELVFRLIGVTGVVWVLTRVLGIGRWLAVVFAVVMSSFLFSLAHHVIGGEPFRIGVFIYRFLCGVFFAALNSTRGFAVAVYTHALYDIYVLFIHG